MNTTDLTDAEVLGLIQLLNDAANERAEFGDPIEVLHRNSGMRMEIVPLVRKLLREGLRRNLLKLPPCFCGEL